MYYQLTMQFGTDEIEDAKKVLELAKELDLKRAGLEEKLPEPETFPWEEDAPKQEAPKQEEPTIPRAKDWMPMEEPTPEPVNPTPKPDQASKPAAPAKKLRWQSYRKPALTLPKKKAWPYLKYS